MDIPLPAKLSAEELNQISIESWNTNAQYWDSYMGDKGNDFYKLLELPALERLVGIQQDEHVLDLTTGNGLVARRMAELGGIVIASDASAGMLECARARTTAEEGRRVTYRFLDVTKEEELNGFIDRAKEVRSAYLPSDILGGRRLGDS
jgi:2-polyprenyl-3-methyl-5-hydroxy-6-metoxy-1,4-benzoquinol methylase